MFRLKEGSIIYNTTDFLKSPGVPQFKKGYYIVTKIEEGLVPLKVKLEERMTYNFQRIYKNGKLMKYQGRMYCRAIDKLIEFFRLIKIVKE
jgi:hypothetical protein